MNMKRNQTKKEQWIEAILRVAKIIKQTDTIESEGTTGKAYLVKSSDGTATALVYVYMDMLRSGYAIRIKQLRTSWPAGIKSRISRVFPPENVTVRSYSNQIGTWQVLQIVVNRPPWRGNEPQVIAMEEIDGEVAVRLRYLVEDVVTVPLVDVFNATGKEVIAFSDVVDFLKDQADSQSMAPGFENFRTKFISAEEVR